MKNTMVSMKKALASKVYELVVKDAQLPFMDARARTYEFATIQLLNVATDIGYDMQDDLVKLFKKDVAAVKYTQDELYRIRKNLAHLVMKDF